MNERPVSGSQFVLLNVGPGGGFPRLAEVAADQIASFKSATADVDFWQRLVMGRLEANWLIVWIEHGCAER